MIVQDLVNIDVHSRLDITRDRCPMTYVRVRLALDRLQPGQVLLVELRGDEPRTNVPHTATAQGHAVLRQQTTPDGAGLLWIRKAGQDDRSEARSTSASTPPL